MFCKNCGKELENTTKFCQYCGSEVAKEKHVAFIPCCKNIFEKIKTSQMLKMEFYKNNKKVTISLICVGVLLLLLVTAYFLFPFIFTKISISHYDKKNYTKAIEWCDLAIKINSKYSDAYYNRANAKWEDSTIEDNYQKAKSDYDVAISLNPRNAEYYFARGKQIGSKNDLDKAISLKPNEAKYYSERAYINLWQNNYTESLNDANKAISLKANDPEIYYARASVYEAMNKWKEAIKDLDKAIELKSDNANYYGMRGDIKKELWDFKGALRDYDTAIKINPNKADIYFLGRSGVMLQQKQYKNAIKELDKAIEVNKTSASLYIYRGITKNHINDRQGAMKDADIAINLASNNEDKAAAYNLRGVIKRNRGNYSSAAADFHKAYELDHKNDYLNNYSNASYNSIMSSFYWY